jgi:hypothetical protein
MWGVNYWCFSWSRFGLFNNWLCNWCFCFYLWDIFLFFDFRSCSDNWLWLSSDLNLFEWLFL